MDWPHHPIFQLKLVKYSGFWEKYWILIMCVDMCTQCPWRPDISDTLELELQAVMHYLMWEPGFELKESSVSSSLLSHLSSSEYSAILNERNKAW